MVAACFQRGRYRLLAAMAADGSPLLRCGAAAWVETGARCLITPDTQHGQDTAQDLANPCATLCSPVGVNLCRSG
jgi:hypothetical protein